jgi:hypothetical protein
MVWPAPRTKTSSLFALQEATLGPALNRQDHPIPSIVDCAVTRSEMASSAVR